MIKKNEILKTVIAINHEGKEIILFRPYKKYRGMSYDML